jgi:hypothetical protein
MNREMTSMRSQSIGRRAFAVAVLTLAAGSTALAQKPTSTPRPAAAKATKPVPVKPFTTVPQLAGLAYHLIGQSWLPHPGYPPVYTPFSATLMVFAEDDKTGQFTGTITGYTFGQSGRLVTGRVVPQIYFGTSYAISFDVYGPSGMTVVSHFDGRVTHPFDSFPVISGVLKTPPNAGLQGFVDVEYSEDYYIIF